MLPENAIIAYGAAPEIESVTATAPVFRPKSKKAWSRGFLFKVHFSEPLQLDQGVQVRIKTCTASVDADPIRVIPYSCSSQDQYCFVMWDAKDHNNHYVNEGCYQAEFYGAYTGGEYLSLSPVSWRLYFDLYY